MACETLKHSRHLSPGRLIHLARPHRWILHARYSSGNQRFLHNQLRRRHLAPSVPLDGLFGLSLLLYLKSHSSFCRQPSPTGHLRRIDNVYTFPPISMLSDAEQARARSSPLTLPRQLPLSRPSFPGPQLLRDRVNAVINRLGMLRYFKKDV
jgi:hypothetical protein